MEFQLMFCLDIVPVLIPIWCGTVWYTSKLPRWKHPEPSDAEPTEPNQYRIRTVPGFGLGQGWKQSHPDAFLLSFLIDQHLSVQYSTVLTWFLTDTSTGSGNLDIDTWYVDVGIAPKLLLKHTKHMYCTSMAVAQYSTICYREVLSTSIATASGNISGPCLKKMSFLDQIQELTSWL